MVEHRGDRLADRPLDRLEILGLFGVDQRDGDTRAARPAGATDTVDVALGLVRELEVEDVRHVVDVEAARREVGRDQHADRAAAEAVERALARILRLVPMDRRRDDAVALEVLHEPVGAVLGPREHDRPLHRGLRQQLGDQPALVGLVDEQDALIDALDGRRLRRHLDAHGVVEKARRELGDRTRHRRREEQVLPLGRQHAEHAPDVVDEPHVEHAVRLVEDEEVHATEVDEAAPDEVEEATRGRDQDVERLLQLADLRVLVDAAEDDHGADGQVAAVRDEAVADLGGQLARRREDERADAARAAGRRCEVLQHGQRERGGLTGAGLGAAEDIAAGEERRDRLGLDRRRSGVALFVEGGQEGLDEPEVTENGQAVPIEWGAACAACRRTSRRGRPCPSGRRGARGWVSARADRVAARGGCCR
ncbi:MAG: hypothetical protein H6698_05120 [Myxococcales bacterium]|nr:hypothetical protein [Myxococcales bacterium]